MSGSLTLGAVGKAPGLCFSQNLDLRNFKFQRFCCACVWQSDLGCPKLSKIEVAQTLTEVFEIIRKVLETPPPVAVSLGSPQLSCPEPHCINASLILNGSNDPGTPIWDVRGPAGLCPGSCKTLTTKLTTNSNLGHPKTKCRSKNSKICF